LRKGVEQVGDYPFQAGGEDPAQDGIISGMDYDLVLAVTKVLEWVALTGIAIKKSELRPWEIQEVRNSIMSSKKRELDASLAMALDL